MNTNTKDDDENDEKGLTKSVVITCLMILLLLGVFFLLGYRLAYVKAINHAIDYLEDVKATSNCYEFQNQINPTDLFNDMLKNKTNTKFNGTFLVGDTI